ncbi:MAG: BON domain-containing protein [Gammaproteobacteria bacterium]|nr:BON domain-containing protein [Gammaproteobacteria bacterium]
MHNFPKILVLAILLSALQGCATAIMLAAAAITGGTGVSVFNDRRSTELQDMDNTIVTEIERLLAEDRAIMQSARVNVESYNKIVLMTGEAPSDTLRLRAADLALSARCTPDVDMDTRMMMEAAGQTPTSIKCVRKIYNEIRLVPPGRTAASGDDVMITSKIKATLVAYEGTDFNHAHVTTENGTVYLMGLLTRKEADRVVYIARRVDGVRKVVPLFEYVRMVAQ